MTTYFPDTTVPGIINYSLSVRNGLAPRATYVERCAQATNHIAAYRKKHFYSQARALSAIPAGISSARTFGQAYVWTGYNTQMLYFDVGMVRTTVSAQSRVKITITRLSNSSTQSLYFYWSAFATGHSGDIPDKMQWLRKSVAVNANEAYSAQIDEENYARCVAVCGSESGGVPVNTGNTGIVDESFAAVGRHILDADQEDIMEAQTNLWKRNGAVLAWYSEDTTLLSAANTSYGNIHDTSITSVAATSPGFTIDLRYHACKSESTVPVRIACLAQRVAGAGTVGDNRVRFVNSNGDAVGITGIDNTRQWWTADGTLPIGSGADKYDFQVQTASGDTVAIAAAQVFCYV